MKNLSTGPFFFEETMYQIFKNKFINPSQIAMVEVEDQKIVDKDNKAKLKATITMSNGIFYEFIDEKLATVKVVNDLFAMINTVNNPFLSLPAQTTQKSDEQPKRIPSDGAGPGSHKVDSTVFPRDKLGPDGFPLVDDYGNKVKDITPGFLAKQEHDAEAKRVADEARKKSLKKKLEKWKRRRSWARFKLRVQQQKKLRKMFSDDKCPPRF